MNRRSTLYLSNTRFRSSQLGRTVLLQRRVPLLPRKGELADSMPLKSDGTRVTNDRARMNGGNLSLLRVPDLDPLTRWWLPPQRAENSSSSVRSPSPYKRKNHLTFVASRRQVGSFRRYTKTVSTTTEISGVLTYRLNRGIA